MAVLSATSSSARQLFLVLRCIAFSSRTQVQVSETGLRFSVDDARSIQGLAMLDKSLFTSYAFDAKAASEHGPQLPGEEALTPTFQVSLPALLETLQIFGSLDQKEGFMNRGDDDFNIGFAGAATRNSTGAFDSRTLGMSGLCRLSYEGAGHPFGVHLEEGNVMTTADLVAYEPEVAVDIPFDRESVSLKVVMRSIWLLDAIGEMSSVAPASVTITASPSAPFFALTAVGSHGSVRVEYDKAGSVLETFQVAQTVTNTYKFSLLKAAMRAMATASKISLRGDAQGVLNIQFMIDTDGGNASFVDFRLVPYINEDTEASAVT